ncbi:MAG: hypothetical protein ABIJ39_08305, partial [Chloroflexota bacterium]
MPAPISPAAADPQNRLSESNPEGDPPPPTPLEMNVSSGSLSPNCTVTAGREGPSSPLPGLAARAGRTGSGRAEAVSGACPGWTSGGTVAA